MYPRRLRAVALAAALVTVPLVVGAPASAAPLAPVSAALSGLLATAADTLPMTVLVHGNDLAKALSCWSASR